MDTVTLGRSDLRVSGICLGTMTFGELQVDAAASHRILDHALQRGLNFIDTAEMYPVTPIAEQLRGLQRLVQAGKVRHVGLSNETPWGVAEFLRMADEAGLPRIVSVQNAYNLVNRSVDNGLDEVMHRGQVSLLAYSPLAFGLLSGKYDAAGLDDPAKPRRLSIFAGMKKQRWGRPEALAAARRCNALARGHGLRPARLALAFCCRNWRVASTIIGVTSIEQLDENIDAWATPLSAELLAEIDRIRWQMRDPAQ
ncbi:MAG TPA: aldo/keto reductase [Rubrivivax sp.]|nr:aldo/keto reductase [Rubrivivax sp.]